MSLHLKDWLKLGGLLGLGATGLGAAGIGPLAGLLGGAPSAGGLLGTFGSMSGGAEGAGVGFGAMNVPHAGLMDVMGSKEMGMAGKGLLFANNLESSPQSQTAQSMPPPQQPAHPTSLLYGMTPEELQKRGIFSAGAYLNG